MVEELGQAGIALSTSTSGFNLVNEKQVTDEQIELLKRNRMKISISIDGDPEFHDVLSIKKYLSRYPYILMVKKLSDLLILPPDQSCTINRHQPLKISLFLVQKKQIWEHSALVRREERLTV